jgi:hypothetical protein
VKGLSIEFFKGNFFWIVQFRLFKNLIIWLLVARCLFRPSKKYTMMKLNEKPKVDPTRGAKLNEKLRARDFNPPKICKGKAK